MINNITLIILIISVIIIIIIIITVPFFTANGTLQRSCYCK